MVPEDCFMTINSVPLALRPIEAAKRLSVSQRTLWAWTRAGLIPHVRVGTGRRQTVLYPVAALEAWLADQAAPKKVDAK